MKLHKKSILKWTIGVCLLVTLLVSPKLTVGAWAHGDQLGGDEDGGAVKEEEKGPHGGAVVVSGDNHLEFTVDHGSGEIVLFLLDKELKAIPMPESYSGVVYLTMSDNSKKTFDLKRGTEGQVSHLEADTGIKEIGSFKAVVSLKIGDKRENFRFSWAPAAHSDDESS
ncbi:MAG: hypothetical protein AB1598_00680 [Thermodesulfobacteriota bacterium]